MSARAGLRALKRRERRAPFAKDTNGPPCPARIGRKEIPVLLIVPIAKFRIY